MVHPCSLNLYTSTPALIPRPCLGAALAIRQADTTGDECQIISGFLIP